jgi:hypothetical protein
MMLLTQQTPALVACGCACPALALLQQGCGLHSPQTRSGLPRGLRPEARGQAHEMRVRGPWWTLLQAPGALPAVTSSSQMDTIMASDADAASWLHIKPHESEGCRGSTREKQPAIIQQHPPPTAAHTITLAVLHYFSLPAAVPGPCCSCQCQGNSYSPPKQSCTGHLI